MNLVIPAHEIERDTIVLLKLQLHYAIYRLRFYSNSLIHILSLSNSHSHVSSIQKNRADKSHRVTAALYSDFSKLGCLWELIIGETCCIVFDLKRCGT